MRSGKTFKTAIPFFLVIVAWMFKIVDCGSKLNSWHGPKSFISGVPPIPRDCHGLAAVLDRIYVFGGKSVTEGCIT